MKIDLLVDKLKDVKVSRVDDFADRLNYLWTTCVLVFFTLGIGLQQTFKQPLNCKPDANFVSTWVDYTNNFCYVNGTYHEKLEDYDYKPGFSLGYYQWVPYILAAQALSFYMPHWIYLVLSNFVSKLNIRSIVDRCHDVSSKKQDDVKKELEDVAQVVYAYSTLPHEVGEKQRPRSLGNSLTLIYLFCKLLNVLNILANLMLFVYLVGQGDMDWASNIVKAAYAGNTSTDEAPGYFPRVTFCDVTFKTVGQTQVRKIQCLLMINILTEKVFVFLHFWFLGVLILTSMNFFYAIYEVLLASHKRAYILSKRSFDETDENDDGSNSHNLEKMHSEFQNYLGLNGNLLVRFIEEHAGSLVASRFVDELARLWRHEVLVRMGLWVPPIVVEDKKDDKDNQGAGAGDNAGLQQGITAERVEGMAGPVRGILLPA